jgi:hypothetical protein
MILLGYGSPAYNGMGQAGDALDAIPGVSTVIDYIKGKAKAGAEQAIPDIQQQVKDTVQPYIIGALALGTFGLLFGLAAYKRSKRAKPALSGARRRR